MLKIHIVQLGDTLWKLAEKYNVSFEEVKKINSHLADPEKLMPGMKIKIPGSAKQVPKEMPSKKKEHMKKEQTKAKKEQPEPKEKKEKEKKPEEKKEKKAEHPYQHTSPKPIQALKEDDKKEKPKKKLEAVAPKMPKMPAVPSMPVLEKETEKKKPKEVKPKTQPVKQPEEKPVKEKQVKPSEQPVHQPLVSPCEPMPFYPQMIPVVYMPCPPMPVCDPYMVSPLMHPGFPKMPSGGDCGCSEKQPMYAGSQIPGPAPNMPGAAAYGQNGYGQKHQPDLMPSHFQPAPLPASNMNNSNPGYAFHYPNMSDGSTFPSLHQPSMEDTMNYQRNSSRGAFMEQNQMQTDQQAKTMYPRPPFYPKSSEISDQTDKHDPNS